MEPGWTEKRERALGTGLKGIPGERQLALSHAGRSTALVSLGAFNV